MKIDLNKVNKNTRLGFLNEESILSYITAVVNYLYKNNKNYTLFQYYKIEDLKSIIEGMYIE